MPQLGEIPLYFGAKWNSELTCKSRVALFDPKQIRLVCLRERRIEELLEAIGDTGDGGMHDQHACAAIEPAAGHFCDVVPVDERRNARTAELENYPRRGRARHGLFTLRRTHGGSRRSCRLVC